MRSSARNVVCLMITIMVPNGSSFAAERVGYEINADWGGPNNMRVKTVAIVAGNDLLIETDWDQTRKSFAGRSPIRIVRVPQSGGSKCISLKTSYSDIEWNKNYCINASKAGAAIRITYNISSKVVDAAPDTLDRAKIMGRVYKENYSIAFKVSGSSCSAAILSGNAGGPNMNSYHLVGGGNATCRIIRG